MARNFKVFKLTTDESKDKLNQVRSDEQRDMINKEIER